MEIIDFNGVGNWSREAILERYAVYAHRLEISPQLNLVPMEHDEGGRHWVYPVMFNVIKGIERGDGACIEIGIQCIEENQWFKFGRTIKSNTARALRRSNLTPPQIERLRSHIVKLLLDEHIPRHYRQYAKLMRKVGLGDWWPIIERQANRNNPYVMHYYDYFQQYLLSEAELL